MWKGKEREGRREGERERGRGRGKEKVWEGREGEVKKSIYTHDASLQNVTHSHWKGLLLATGT